MIAAVSAADRFFGRGKIVEGDLIEAFHGRPETVEIFFLSTRSERRQRAPVKGALEGDDPIAFGLAAHRLIFPRRLDRALGCFGAGIAEEYDVGKARRA